MKIIAFNGSPRGSKSNTYIMVESFLDGAKAAGAEVEQILLGDKDIKHCQGCFACWFKTPGQCVIKDDMEELLKKFTAADIVVIATPLYVFNVTGIMKDFMDRTIPLVDPHFEATKDGVCSHVSRNNTAKKFVIISNCGFPEQEHFEVLHNLFNKTWNYQVGEVLAEIYRGQGAILTNHPLLLSPIINGYKKLLEEAGSQIVKNSKLSEELIAKLNKPLIPIDMYIKEANKGFDKVLKK